jgi:superfamily II DNA/RNA helicase
MFAGGALFEFLFELACSKLDWSSVSPSFHELGVPARLVARLKQQGIASPFPIQAATIPDVLAGRDVCGRAPTGSGKTIAFAIAVVSAAAGSAPRRPRALVLVPTRELARQVQGEIALLAGDHGKRTIAVYGGTAYEANRRALNRGVDIVVACPGRLEDLLAQRALSLGDVRTVVLDEADRMADMGFLPAVRRLMDQTSAERQVLLFSATLGREVESIITQYQRDPVHHDVRADDSSVGEVAHIFWRAERSDRVHLTARLVTQHGRALVFCRTRRGADRVARQLGQAGISAVAIHGDRTQAQRERALAAFAHGRAHALVATDVAARGIHVDDLPCVVHFDPPTDATDYLHRSGRTGRAGKTGTVVSLVTNEHHSTVRSMQRALGLNEGLDAPDGPCTATVTAALSADRGVVGRSRSGQPTRRIRKGSNERTANPGRSTERARGARGSALGRRQGRAQQRRAS